MYQADDTIIIMSFKEKYSDFYNFFMSPHCISFVYYVWMLQGQEKGNNFMYYIIWNLSQKEGLNLNFNNDGMLETCQQIGVLNILTEHIVCCTPTTITY